MEETFKKVMNLDFPQYWSDLVSGIVDSLKKCNDQRSLQSPLLVLALVVNIFVNIIVREVSSRDGS